MPTICRHFKNVNSTHHKKNIYSPSNSIHLNQSTARLCTSATFNQLGRSENRAQGRHSSYRSVNTVRERETSPPIYTYIRVANFQPQEASIHPAVRLICGAPALEHCISRLRWRFALARVCQRLPPVCGVAPPFAFQACAVRELLDVTRRWLLLWG